MKLSTLPKMLKFMSDLSRAAGASNNLRIIRKNDRECPSGTVYDLYSGKDPKGPVVIALQGMTVNGRRDSRLTAFACALASSGARCLVPELRGLSSCRFDPSDLDRLEDVVDAAGGLFGKKALLVGFSFGGGYALSVAGRESCKSKIGGVISFGAHHSLPQLFDLLASTKNIVPRTEDEWDNWIYLKLAFLHGGYASGDFDAAFKDRAFDLMKRYCHESTPAEKRSFHDLHLSAVDVQAAAGSADRAALEAVSPAGRLGLVACRAGLLHDRNDSLIPSSHTLQNYAEITGGGGKADMLVTSLLSHVTPAAALKAGELYGMVDILEPFFLAGG